MGLRVFVAISDLGFKRVKVIYSDVKRLKVILIDLKGFEGICKD